ncbi:MAG: hypothetical protein AAFY77_08710 [Pseudomonadota bacterium]
MSQEIEIAAHEQGVLRLFAIDLPPQEAQGFLRAFDETGTGVLAEGLGLPTLNPDYVEVFAGADIDDIGLSAYLVEGYSITDSALADDAARLDNMEGCFAVILSSAFDAHAQTLSVRPPLRLIATYRDAPAVPEMGALPSDSAEGVLPRGSATPSARRGLSGWVIAGAIALIAGVLVFAVAGGGDG